MARNNFPATILLFTGERNNNLPLDTEVRAVDKPKAILARLQLVYGKGNYLVDRFIVDIHPYRILVALDCRHFSPLDIEQNRIRVLVDQGKI